MKKYNIATMLVAFFLNLLFWLPGIYDTSYAYGMPVVFTCASALLINKTKFTLQTNDSLVLIWMGVSFTFQLLTFMDADILKSYIALLMIYLAFKRIPLPAIKCILRQYALIAILILIIFLIFGLISKEQRFSELRSPNSMAAYILSIALGILCWKRGLLKFAAISFVMYASVVIESRNGLVSLIALIVLSVLTSNEEWTFEKIFYATGFIVLLSIGIMANIEAFQLDDQYRGLDSGFTGRTIAWAHAIEVIRENIWLGVGAGNAYKYFTNIFGQTDSSSYEYMLTGPHSGHLRLLMEFGIVNSLIFYCLVVKIVRHHARHDLDKILAIFTVSYFIFGIFEELLLNVGNPVSLIFIMLLVSNAAVKSQVNRPVSLN